MDIVKTKVRKPIVSELALLGSKAQIFTALYCSHCLSHAFVTLRTSYLSRCESSSNWWLCYWSPKFRMGFTTALLGEQITQVHSIPEDNPLLTSDLKNNLLWMFSSDGKNTSNHSLECYWENLFDMFCQSSILEVIPESGKYHALLVKGQQYFQLPGRKLLFTSKQHTFEN